MSFQNPLPPGIRQVVPDYVSDGVQLAWGFPFRLWSAADLWVGVSADGGATWTQLVLGTNYTVAIAGVVSALVNFTVVQPKGTLIRLMGLRTPSRTTSVVNDGVLQSSPFESELDCLEATAQEARRDIAASQALIAALQAAIATLQANLTGISNAWVATQIGAVLGFDPNNLPTTEPTTPGTYWNNGHALCVTPGGSNPLPTTTPAGFGVWWNDGGLDCIS